MTDPSPNARLAPPARARIVARIVAAQAAAKVVAAVTVSLRTRRQWLARFRAGGAAAPPDALPPHRMPRAGRRAFPVRVAARRGRP